MSFDPASTSFLTLAVGFNVAHNAALKASSEHAGALRLSIIAFALLLGLINALCFSKALERMALTIAYPVFSGASVITTLGVGMAMFGEPIALNRVAGALIVIAGIAVIFSK